MKEKNSLQNSSRIEKQVQNKDKLSTFRKEKNNNTQNIIFKSNETPERTAKKNTMNPGGFIIRNPERKSTITLANNKKPFSNVHSIKAQNSNRESSQESLYKNNSINHLARNSSDRCSSSTELNTFSNETDHSSFVLPTPMSRINCNTTLGGKTSMFKTSSRHESQIKQPIDFTYKIVDLIQRIKGLVTFACKQPDLLFNDNIGSISDNSNFSINENELDVRKTLSENLDLSKRMASQEIPLFDVPRITNSNAAIDHIYRASVELKDLVKLNFLNIDENDEEIEFESTRNNVNQIAVNSETMMSMYRKLFEKCNLCYKDIKSKLLVNELTCSPDKYHLELQMKVQGLLNKKSGISVESESNINNACEKINVICQEDSQLSERYDKQQLRKVRIIARDLLKVEGNNPFIRKGTNFTEGDNNEAILNENVLVNMIPVNKVFEVNKPKNDTETLKFLNNLEFSLDDSQIVQNLNNLREIYNQKEDCSDDFFDNKTLNQTISQETFKRKRSRSLLIKQETKSYSIQTKRKNDFDNAKNDMESFALRQQLEMGNKTLVMNKDENCIIY